MILQFEHAEIADFGVRDSSDKVRAWPVSRRALQIWIIWRLHLRGICMKIGFYPPGDLDIKGGTKDRETETMPRGADTKNDCPELEVY